MDASATQQVPVVDSPTADLPRVPPVGPRDSEPEPEPRRRRRRRAAPDEPDRPSAVGPEPGDAPRRPDAFGERPAHDAPPEAHDAPGEREGPAQDSREERPPAAKPARRATPEQVVAFSAARSLLVAGFSGTLAVLLLFGSRLDQPWYAAVCFVVQALFVGAWTWGGRSAGPQVVAAAGAVGAIAADVVAVYSPEASLAPLGYVVAGTFVLGVIGQLVRRKGRSRVTESIGAVAVVAVGVVALATPVLLSRYPAGGEALFACLLATGVALVVAHLSDAVLRTPRAAPQVPRGAPGVVLGAMAGTAVAGFTGSIVVGLTPQVAAVAGLVVALAAVLADLGMVFAETGRLLAGEDASRWPIRAALGPLVGLAVATPAAYLLSVLMIVKGF